jgi:hypothetical protein
MKNECNKAKKGNDNDEAEQTNLIPITQQRAAA